MHESWLQIPFLSPDLLDSLTVVFLKKKNNSINTFLSINACPLENHGRQENAGRATTNGSHHLFYGFLLVNFVKLAAVVNFCLLFLIVTSSVFVSCRIIFWSLASPVTQITHTHAGAWTPLGW